MVCTSCIQAAEDETWSATTGGEPADLCMSLGAQMSAHDCITTEPCACTYPHAAREYYQTMIFVQVLSENPLTNMTLHDVADEITTGDCSGKITGNVTKVDGPTMAKLLREQGSDPEFFGLTDQGPQAPDSQGPTKQPVCPPGADICGGARCTRDDEGSD